MCNWFDPLTVIRAIATLGEDHPKLRLYFLGVKHPNPDVPAMRMAADAMQLAESLELTDNLLLYTARCV